MKFLYIMLFSVTLLLSSNLKNNTEIKNIVFSNLRCDIVILKPIYDTCFDYYYVGPLAVAYKIDKALISNTNIVKRPTWQTELLLEKQYKVTNKDYYKTGYDKGHLAFDSAFDYRYDILKYTYVLGSNSIPQNTYINRYIWKKIEQYSLKVAKVYSIIYDIDIIDYGIDPKRLNNHIAIPKGFYKILYNKDLTFKECYYVGNILLDSYRRAPVSHFKVDCSNVKIHSIKVFKLFK